VTFIENNSDEKKQNLDNEQVVGESHIKIKKDEKEWKSEIIEYLKKW